MESTGSDLVASIASTAVQVLSTVATGTATGVGQAVGEVVRAKLSGSDQGRAALAASPSDDGAAENLRSTLESALVSDPEFRAALVTALAGVPSAGPLNVQRSMVFGNSTVRGTNNFALGDQSISHHRRSHGWLTAAAVLVAAVLVGLAIYGSVRLVDGNEPDSAPGESNLGPQVTGGQPANGGQQVVRDRDLATKILPDRNSVPSGWQLQDGMPQEGICPPGCQNRLVSVMTAYYPDETTDYVWVDVHTFGSVEDAEASYPVLTSARLDLAAEDAETKFAGDYPSLADEYLNSELADITLQDTGADEYRTVYWHVELGRGFDAKEFFGLDTVIRVGTVVANIGTLSDFTTPDDTLVQAVVRAVVERAQQAQYGEDPSAVVNMR